MDKIPYTGKEIESKEAFDFVRQNALGNIIIATQQPTSSTLKANQLTFYGGELYLKLSNGNAYKFTLTAI